MTNELALIEPESEPDDFESRLSRIEKQLSEGEERMQILERRSDPKLETVVGTILDLLAYVDDLIERVTKLEQKHYAESVRKQIEETK